MDKIADRLNQKRALRRWQRHARQAAAAPLDRLRVQRNAARELMQPLSRLIHVADGRLALPAVDTAQFHRPHGTDWSWRPEAWRGPLAVPGLCAAPSGARLGGEVTLFHDCTHSELSLRQPRLTGSTDTAPFGLKMDVFRFDGSFLSLVVDLPPAATQGLERTHLLRVEVIVETERPIEIFARLNVAHGPNTEQMVREVPRGDMPSMVEFDMAYSRLNEKRVERAWLDLIFEAPDMNQMTIRDLTFARYRRAAL